MIAIIDYQAANLTSVATTLRKMGAEVRVVSQPEQLAAAERFVLPGVGAFDPAMRVLRQRGLDEALHELVIEQGRPILGICLGLHLFARSSEEGNEPGLGWIDAQVRRFRTDGRSNLKVPHIGWNDIRLRKPHPLVEGVPDGATVYFAHSYFVQCEREEDVLTTTHYGHDFASAIQVRNIVGIQFHPEKSHRLGKQLLGNFLGLAG